MPRTIVIAVLCATLGACNTESPTALSDFNPASIRGEWGVTFSSATCSLREMRISFAQISDGGPLPDTIGLVGSWQNVGEATKTNLTGKLVRATGEITLELILGVRRMAGIALDNNNLALGYTDVATPCTARAAVRRLE